MVHPGWMLLLVGAVLILAGVIWIWGPPLPWLGRLPGDIAVERDGFRFYFPIVTCLLLSVLVSGLIWLFRVFWR